MIELDATKSKLARKTEEFSMVEEFYQAERSKVEESEKLEVRYYSNYNQPFIHNILCIYWVKYASMHLESKK